jgi:hypothetical protein
LLQRLDARPQRVFRVGASCSGQRGGCLKRLLNGLLLRLNRSGEGLPTLLERGFLSPEGRRGGNAGRALAQNPVGVDDQDGRGRRARLRDGGGGAAAMSAAARSNLVFIRKQFLH